MSFGSKQGTQQMKPGTVVSGKSVPRGPDGLPIPGVIVGKAVPRGTAIGGPDDLGTPIDAYSAAAAAASAARAAAARTRKRGQEQNVLTKTPKKTTGAVPAQLTPRTLIGGSY